MAYQYHGFDGGKKMLTAIVPARNEEGRISKLLNTLLSVGEINRIVVVLNGSIDGTLEEVRSIPSEKIISLFFHEALGIDVPRAVGAAYAKKAGSLAYLFIDGDLVGDIRADLKTLINNAHRQSLDMALTDCYPSLPQKNLFAKKMLVFREMLNKATGLYDTITVASPSHGPHLLSSRLVDVVTYQEIAIPPVAMVRALKKCLSIGIAAKIPHSRLGSSIKSMRHSHLVCETIIGDSIEALEVFYEQKRTRTYQGKAYTGYHEERRFDLLEKFVACPEKYVI
jgi:hypothetical protein